MIDIHEAQTEHPAEQPEPDLKQLQQELQTTNELLRHLLLEVSVGVALLEARLPAR